MTSWNGWAGSVLNVDLTNMNASKEELSREFAIKYIGGSGFGARILYDEVGPEVNPLEPENVFIIGQGPLSGTESPGSGRYDVITKSPLTGIYLRTNGGGFFGPEIKYAGYDLIVIRGRAKKPVYLWIDDEQVELRDATHLWGKDTWTTQQMIREELGDPDIKTLKIGPAGENMCYSAGVIGDLNRAAGRNGNGAVLGSKNCKAVAVRGSKGVSIAKPKEFKELCQSLRERAKRDPMYTLLTTYGTTAWVSYPSMVEEQKKKGLTTPHPLFYSNFDAFFDKNLACFSCPYACSHYYSVKSGKYKGTDGVGIEAGAGQGTARSVRAYDPAFACKINNLINRLGLTQGASGIPWAMHLYQDGIITKEDTDGLELTWGNEEVVLELIRKIAYKEGFGAIVDDPVKGAEKLGRGSDLYNQHIKKASYGVSGGMAELDEPIYRPLAKGTAVRGHDHLMSATSILKFGFRPEQMPAETLERIGEERYNDPTLLIKPYSPNPKFAQLVYDTETAYALADSTGTCKFASEQCLNIEGIHLKEFAQLLSTTTGVDFSVDDLTRAAAREILLERSFNAREGIRRIDDYPYPWHYQLKHDKEHPRYDYSKFKYTIEDYDKLLDEYYRLRGCDRSTGIPTREALEALGLKDVAEDLEYRGILPK